MTDRPNRSLNPADYTFNEKDAEIAQLQKEWGGVLAMNAEIARLRADNERLREALSPFVMAFNAKDDPGVSDLYNDQPFHITVPLGSCRRARAAFAEREV